MIPPKRKNLKDGFNLMELLVILAIIAIVNLSIISWYPRFNRTMLLKKTTAQIALVIRQAQTNSLAVKRFEKSATNPFPDYGTHFERNKGYFSLFADTNGNGIYGGSSGCADAECAEFFSINNSSIVGDVQLCDSSDCSNVNKYIKIDIVYPRGRTAALASARGTDSSGQVYDCSSCSYAKIAVRSTGDLVLPKYLYVWYNGQISIKDN